jgi:hypothetical protein
MQMNPQTRTVLVGLAAALLAVAAPASAHAAQGNLYINSGYWKDPTGCIKDLDGNGPEGYVSILNYTDQSVTVYLTPDCKGTVAGTVPSNVDGTFVGVRSVSLP